MLIKTIWTDNAMRNFNFLIVCEETGEALAIDPLDHKKCLALSQREGYEIRQILNTHEHWDHVGGNAKVVEQTDAKVLAHYDATSTIDGVDIGLKAGDCIKVGKTVELEVLDTPGHTMSHVCALAHGHTTAIFSGDTLFNAGAGNCHNGGHPNELYETFAKQIYTLAEDTKIYPGHDYLANNLAFTLDREPSNTAAQSLLKAAQEMDANDPIVTTIALERQINTFFRLEVPAVIAKLQADGHLSVTHPEPRDVFLKLRELRNHW